MQQKKHALAFTFAALLAGAGSAFAESNVTVYGIADLSLNHLSGSSGGQQANGSVTRLDSNAGNNLAGSRLGFKGTEDLGGGLSADFKLEMGITMDTGKSEQGGVLFGRAAKLGLNGGFGSVHVGRQDTPAFELLNSADPMGVGLAASAGNIHIGNAALFPVGGLKGVPQQGWIGLGAIRANNSIRYDTPKLGGFNASLLYGLGEVAGTSDGGVGILGLNYSQGPMYLGYVHIDDRSAGLAIAATEGWKQRSDALAFTYDFGAAKLHALVASKTADYAGVQDKANYYLAGLSAPVGKTGQVMVSWNRSAGKNSSANSADQFGLGYMYFLSKRTFLYTSYGQISNKDKAAFGIDGYDNHDGKAFDYSKMINVGITHFF